MKVSLSVYTLFTEDDQNRIIFDDGDFDESMPGMGIVSEEVTFLKEEMKLKEKQMP